MYCGHLDTNQTTVSNDFQSCASSLGPSASEPLRRVASVDASVSKHHLSDYASSNHRQNRDLHSPTVGKLVVQSMTSSCDRSKSLFDATGASGSAARNALTLSRVKLTLCSLLDDHSGDASRCPLTLSRAYTFGVCNLFLLVHAFVWLLLND